MPRATKKNFDEKVTVWLYNEHLAFIDRQIETYQVKVNRSDIMRLALESYIEKLEGAGTAPKEKN